MRYIILNIKDSKSPLYFTKNSAVVRAYTICPDETSGMVENVKLRNTSDALQPLNRDEIFVNADLSNKQKTDVFGLIDSYRDCFAQNLSKLGCTQLTELDIRLTDDIPVVYRPYRLIHSGKEVVRDTVKELLHTKIIEESESAYASPVILVSKKTGGCRLCVDYRALNRKTIKGLFPLPRIDDQIDLLSGNKYFISLDMASGYYQIPVKEQCRHLTAFKILMVYISFAKRLSV